MVNDHPDNYSIEVAYKILKCYEKQHSFGFLQDKTLLLMKVNEVKIFFLILEFFLSLK